MQDQAGRLVHVERDPGAACEVVAGAHREQAQDLGREFVAAVQGGDHRVQAAVAAGHDDPARPGPVQRAVELARTGCRRDLDGGLAAEDLERGCQLFVVGGAGVGIGNHQDRVHRVDTT